MICAVLVNILVLCFMSEHFGQVIEIQTLKLCAISPFIPKLAMNIVHEC